MKNERKEILKFAQAECSGRGKSKINKQTVEKLEKLENWYSAQFHLLTATSPPPPLAVDDENVYYISCRSYRRRK